MRKLKKQIFLPKQLIEQVLELAHERFGHMSRRHFTGYPCGDVGQHCKYYELSQRVNKSKPTCSNVEERDIVHPIRESVCRFGRAHTKIERRLSVHTDMH